jgi:hypothetical protein
MQKKSIAAATLIGTLALTLFAAGPVSAATDTENVEVAVVAGDRTLTTLLTGSFATIVSADEARSYDGVTIAVDVEDATGGTTGWNVTVTAGGFTQDGISATGVMADAALAYTTGAVATVPVNDVTVVLPAAFTLDGTEQSAAAVTTTSGFNTASWTAALAVSVPANAIVGAYNNVVTHSIL